MRRVRAKGVEKRGGGVTRRFVGTLAGKKDTGGSGFGGRPESGRVEPDPPCPIPPGAQLAGGIGKQGPSEWFCRVNSHS